MRTDTISRRQQAYKAILLLIVTLLPLAADAQCAMCRASAEGTAYAKSLNSGILYLLLFPVTVFFGGGLLWYLNRKKFQVNDWE